MCVGYLNSYFPVNGIELISAFLWAQMEAADEITHKRLAIWHQYHFALEPFEKINAIRRPMIPDRCTQNAHMYYVLLPNLEKRTAFISFLKENNVGAVFHYVPLHSAPAAHKFGRTHGSMSNTDNLSDRLVRLPLWVGLDSEFDRVISTGNL